MKPITPERKQTMERVKMALAEAGYSPDDVRFDPDGSQRVSLFVPDDVIWRARELAEANRAVCLACYVSWSDRWAYSVAKAVPAPTCDATTRLEPDCGRDR